MLVSRRPPNVCLYCLNGVGPFSRLEHPIPESLGNDDLVIPPGFVCDSCNQFFGTKVEHDILTKAPFGIQRAAQAIRNKNGRMPKIFSSGLTVQSTGCWDNVVIQSDHPHKNIAMLPNGQWMLNPMWSSPNVIVRFLLKMGLGLLIFADEVDPYSDSFDSARECARRGTGASDWGFAMGLYPDRNDLTTATRTDEIGPLETRQIYHYDMGVMASGNVGFCFMFSTMVFAVNLTNPAIQEYIIGFNAKNEFHLESRWQAFHR